MRATGVTDWESRGGDGMQVRLFDSIADTLR